MLRGNYILDGHIPVRCDDFREWAIFMEGGDKTRRVAIDRIGPACISTVFLGIDHAWMGGPPLLFETMVFWRGHALNEECERYSTWDEAVAGHAAMVQRVREAQK